MNEKNSKQASPLYYEDVELLKKLKIGIGETSEITGIPQRQLRYWEEKGIIKSVSHEKGNVRKYDYKNIKKILLIKELLDEGFTLESAANKVEKRISYLDTIFKKLQLLEDD